jgi:peptidyl-Asp metalloendopeptidase
MKIANSTRLFGLVVTGMLWLSGCTDPSDEPGAHSDLLFTSSETTSPTSSIGLRSRQTQMNTHSLLLQSGPAQGAPEQLTLNLFPDAVFSATKTREVQLSESAWSWHGVVDNTPMSEVTITVNGEMIAANIHAEHADFQIRTTSSGMYTIEEVDLSSLANGAEPVSTPLFDAFDEEEATAHDSDRGATADAATIVDVLVVYTAEAVSGAGSEEALNTEILLALSETNEGYVQSNVEHRLRLASQEQLEWDETAERFDFSSTLTMLANPSDNIMDEVHALRDAVGADEVVLIVEGDNSYCGIGYLMTHPSAAFAPFAFSVVARVCAAGNYSFAHEVGHNMGSNHNHSAASDGAYPFSYGYQAPDVGVRTVMAYGCPTSYCRRVNRWSNPATSWESHALGVAGNGADAADNHESLNRTARVVAGFRDEVPVTTPNAPEFIHPADGASLSGATAHLLLQNVHADQYVVTVGDTVGGTEWGRVDLGSLPEGLVSGLPQDGRTLYFRGWARFGDQWEYSDAEVRAFQHEEEGEIQPELLSPTEGSVLPGSTATLLWSSSDASQIVIRVGTTELGSELGQYAVGTSTTLTLRSLPTDGRKIWITLYAKVAGSWSFQSHYFLAAEEQEPQEVIPAEMLTPTPGSALDTATTFTWNNPCDCDYQLLIVDHEGELLFASSEGSALEATVHGLPEHTDLQVELLTIGDQRAFSRTYEYWTP